MSKVVVRDSSPLDRGYGWVVVAASFLLQCISGGIAFSVGVFFVEFLETFQRRQGDTAWIGSINTGLLFGAGPLASVLANKFGHRCIVVVGALLSGLGLFISAFAKDIFTLYFSYGFLAGLGFCFIYVPSVVIVGIYFEKRRNLAMGLASAGFACGNFIMAPLLTALIDIFGWRGAMLIGSGLCLNCCVLGALLYPISAFGSTKVISSKKVKTQSEPKEDQVETLFNISLLKDCKFQIFLANNVLWNIGSLILLVICTEFAYIHGIPKRKGAFLVATIGLCSLIGRLLVAILASHKHCNRFIVFIASTAISGLAICLFPCYKSLTSFMTFAAIYGLFFGSQVGVLAVVTAELFGVKRLTSAYGYLMFGNGTGAMLGPPIAGWLYDSLHRYELSFYLGGGLTILSAAILVCIPVIHRRELAAARAPQLYIVTPDAASKTINYQSPGEKSTSNGYVSSVQSSLDIPRKDGYTPVFSKDSEKCIA